MWLYLIIFAIPLYYFLNGPVENRNKRFLKYYTLFLAFFVGVSDMLGGYDRYIYGEVFDRIADDVTAGIPMQQSVFYYFFETGYVLLNFAVAYFSENRYIFILIVTLIVYFNLYKTFERHFKNYPFAFILFLGMSFFFTFTYLRQVLAFSFAWLGIRYLLEDKKIKFFIIAFIAASFHKSGLVFFMLYFVPIKKWKQQQVIYILTICGLVGLTGITGNMYDVVMESGLTVDQGNEYNTNDSARIAYILEVIFFAWIILKNYDKIVETRENLIFLNMAWAFCIVLLLFVRSGDGGRVAWYFTMGIMYILSLVATVDVSKINRLVRSSTALLLVGLMSVLFIRIFIAWQSGMMLYPYKTFLTDGRRYPDAIADKYEYDTNYNQDKFYRPVFRLLK